MFIVMKVAISHWQGRVSPVFDVARNVLVVETDGGGEQSRREVTFDQAETFPARASRLARTEVNVLICGAISRPLDMAIQALGVEVISQTCGEVECVLRAFMEGQLNSNSFLMPGCRGRGWGSQHRRRGGRCRQNKEKGGDDYAQR